MDFNSEYELHEHPWTFHWSYLEISQKNIVISPSVGSQGANNCKGIRAMFDGIGELEGCWQYQLTMQLLMIVQLIGFFLKKKKRNMANNDILCRHKFIHVRCCAHILNLVVHEDLKNIDDSIVRIRNMVKYVKGSLKDWPNLSIVQKRRQLGVMLSWHLMFPLDGTLLISC